MDEIEYLILKNLSNLKNLYNFFIIIIKVAT